MKIDNPTAKRLITEAMKRSNYDCAEWDIEVLEALALEIIVSLGAQGMFVVKLK